MSDAGAGKDTKGTRSRGTAVRKRHANAVWANSQERRLGKLRRRVQTRDGKRLGRVKLVALGMLEQARGGTDASVLRMISAVKVRDADEMTYVHGIEGDRGTIMAAVLMIEGHNGMTDHIG